MNNIFLIHTEYHLLVTLRIIFSKYRERDNYVYIASSRIPGNYKSHFKNIIFKRLPSDDYGTKNVFFEMSGLNPQNFFFFQDNSSDNIYLSYNFHKKNVKVVLLPDGYKPYPLWHRRFLFINVIRETISFYKEMYRRKALIPSIFMKSYKYGNLRYIDEIWLDYPDKLPTKTTKKLLVLPPTTQEVLDEASYVFGYNSSIDLNNIILYIGQPLDYTLRHFELDFIRSIIDIKPDMKFYYKKHPNALDEQVEGYKKITGLNFYNDKVPAELLICNMKNSIIISPYSAALMSYNPTCRYYWLKNMFPKVRIYSQLEILNPTEHIIEVNSISEIE